MKMEENVIYWIRELTPNASGRYLYNEVILNYIHPREGSSSKKYHNKIPLEAEQQHWGSHKKCKVNYDSSISEMAVRNTLSLQDHYVFVTLNLNLFMLLPCLVGLLSGEKLTKSHLLGST